MNQPSNLNLFELLNFCVEHQPDALGVLALNSRVERVKFLKKPTVAAGENGKPTFERVSLVTFGLPERVGENLRGAEEDQAFLVAFSIDRAVYEAFVRRATSPIILPPGAQI